MKQKAPKAPAPAIHLLGELKDGNAIAACTQKPINPKSGERWTRVAKQATCPECAKLPALQAQQQLTPADAAK